MILYSLFVFLLGLIVGSFLNVVILRVPEGQSICGRSRCVACQKSLRWFELFPLFSYITLRGKCRSCRVSISLQYPFVELVTALLFLLTWWMRCWSIVNCQLSIVIVRDWFFIAVLIILFVQDFRFQILPDVITLPAIAIALLILVVTGQMSNVKGQLFAVVLGVLFFLLQWLVSRGRWVGGGDIRLGALMGAILGWPNILLAFFLSYISGAIVGGTLLLLRRVTGKSQIAFGTFLTASTVFTMFWGDQIVSWYAKIIGL